MADNHRYTQFAGRRNALVSLALLWGLACAVSLTAVDAGWAQSTPNSTFSEGLAKTLQNPVGDLISVPLQNNLNLAAGPEHEPQNILNIQPVVPFILTILGT